MLGVTGICHHILFSALQGVESSPLQMLGKDSSNRVESLDTVTHSVKDIDQGYTTDSFNLAWQGDT